ncbi:MAG: GNAT family N-acetyltransferase, partial [Geminicoccaceae bacterium]
MTIGWIGPEDAAWQAFLEQTPHDFYHLPGYVALTARQSGAEPAAFIARDGDAALLVPLHLRSLPDELGAADGLKDALSPYGYPAPLLIAPEDARAERGAELMAAFVDAARAAGIVTTFLRLHPLLTLPEPALRSVGTLVEHGPTVVIDLSEPVARFWTETNNGHRLGIRKLEKADFVARFDYWEAFDDFIEIYRLTMEHVQATEDYFFDRDYFLGLREALGEQLHLCTIHAPDGQVAAAGLFPEVDGLVQNHLSGTHPAFRK